MNQIVSGTDYLTLPRPAQTWLIEPLIPAGGTALVYGPPKVGKSVAAMQMAAAVVTKSDWLGYPARTQGPVVYVQLDNPRSLWADRLKEASPRIPGLLDVMQTDRELLDTYPTFDILNTQHSDILTVALREVNPVLVVVDTLIKSHSAKENDPTEMTAVLARLTAAVRPAALLIVAHNKKPPTNDEWKPSVIHDNRGASSVVGEMDGIISVHKTSFSIVGRAIEDTDFTAWLEGEGHHPIMWHRGKKPG